MNGCAGACEVPGEPVREVPSTRSRDPQEEVGEPVAREGSLSIDRESNKTGSGMCTAPTPGASDLAGMPVVKQKIYTSGVAMERPREEVESFIDLTTNVRNDLLPDCLDAHGLEGAKESRELLNHNDSLGTSVQPSPEEHLPADGAGKRIRIDTRSFKLPETRTKSTGLPSGRALVPRLGTECPEAGLSCRQAEKAPPGPSGRVPNTVGKLQGRIINVPGGRRLSGGEDNMQHSCVPGPSTERVPATGGARPKSTFQKFFRRSDNRLGNQYLYDCSNYMKSRSIISQEAGHQAQPAVRGIPSQIVGREAAAASGVPTSSTRVGADGSQVSYFPGGIEITQVQEEQKSWYRLKISKQSLGLFTRSTSSNKVDKGIFVSEWTAKFATKNGTFLGLLYRLSFLQELEIKLGLHNVPTGSMVKCYRDISIRQNFEQYLPQYEGIREGVRSEIRDIFALYEPGTERHAKGESLVSILLNNTSSRSKPQNNINMVCVF